MNKKIWILGIATVLLLALTGCGKTTEPKPEQQMSSYSLDLACKDFTREDFVDISVLANQTDLTELSLRHDKNISNFNALSNLKNLEVLDLSFAGVSDLSTLSELTSLKVLYLDALNFGYGDDDTKISLAPLSELTNLEVLVLNGASLDNGSRFKDFETLGNLTNLRELHMYHSGVTDRDLGFLSKLKNLEVLDLGGNERSLRGSDLGFLSELTSLKVLSLSSIGHGLGNMGKYYNSVPIDLTPLTGLTNLECLILDFTYVADLSPLIEMTNLRGLDLGYLTSSYDLVSLSKMGFLEYLDIANIDESQYDSLSRTLSQTSIMRSPSSRELLERRGLIYHYYTSPDVTYQTGIPLKTL